MARDNSNITFMSALQIAESRALGERIIREMYQNKPRPNANAAIRHMRAQNGTGAAIELARELLGIGEREARDLVADLERHTPTDIVSPYFED